MLWWLIIGFFIAFGMLCAGLTLLGWLLHRGCRSLCLVDSGQGGEDALFFLWLKTMGILKCKIYLLNSPEIWQLIEENAEEITGWDVAAQPRTGADEIDRPGNGDPPGNHQCGGVSEL